MIRLADAVKHSDPPPPLLQPEKEMEVIKPVKLDPLPKKKTSQISETELPSKLYEGCIRYVKEVGRCVENNEKFDLKKGQKYIRVILKHSHIVLENMHFLTLLGAGTYSQSLSTHSVNVMISALIVGRELGYTKRELMQLGTAALYHEVGMYLTPKEIREKHGELTDHEYNVIREHPEKAYNYMKLLGPEYENIAGIVLQEHERIDGSGYPYGLEGSQINEHALIIGLLDIYEALINSRPYRDKMSPSEAMKEVVRRVKTLFPVKIIKKLLIQISIYPIKSYVRLNNGSIGMVLQTNHLWPLKPIINVIFDAQGKKLKSVKKIIDLSKTPLLYIKHVIPVEDIEGM